MLRDAGRCRGTSGDAGGSQHPHSIQPDVKSSPNSPLPLWLWSGTCPRQCPCPLCQGLTAITGAVRGTGHLLVINHSDQQQNRKQPRHPTEINETSLLNMFCTRRKTSENRRGQADAFSPCLDARERLRCRRGIKAEPKPSENECGHGEQSRRVEECRRNKRNRQQR